MLFIVDRSGSMFNVAKDMAGGLNKLIEEQKKVGGECRVSLVEFSSEPQVVWMKRPLAEVEANYVLNAGGGTALFDAIDFSFQEFDKQTAFSKMDKVVCVIITDGGENCSMEVTNKATISAKIKEKQEKEGWEVIYLGADHDAFGEAANAGINQATVSSYNKSSRSIDNVYGTLHNKFVGLRTVKTSSMNFTEEEVQAMGSDDQSVDWEKS
jgi:Mg-chelatase subunit ChlD